MADEIENQMTEGPGPSPADVVAAGLEPNAMITDPVPSDPGQPDAMQPDPEPADHVATGHAEIDTALRRLEELDGLPVERHGEIYDELHGRLRDALTAASTPTSESSDA